MHKDTAKWLLTFAPIGAAITFALTVGPRINPVTGANLCEIVREHLMAAIFLGVTLAAAIAIVVLCCYVLFAAATPWTELRDKEDWLSDAFSEHAVGVPLFPASTDFKGAETRAHTGAASSAEHAALAATTARILALSESENARNRFRRFVWGYGLCLVLMLVGLTVAAFTLPSVPDAVTRPATVSLLMPAESAKRFTELTGCASLPQTTAVAVAGAWSGPTLRLIGPGCTPEDWTAPDELGIIAVPN